MSISSISHRWGDPRALAARLNRRLTLQEPTEADDGAGGVTFGWSDVATVWAEITPLRTPNGEVLFAGKVEQRGTHRITLRYRSGLHPSMRIQYGTRLFNIRRITNVNEANVLLEIDAEEGVAP